MSTASIILEGLESSITLAVLGELPTSEVIGALDVSASAVYQVSVATMRKLFNYTTDSLDVVDASTSDLKFYVASEGITDLSSVNVANASVADASAIFTNADDSKKNYVCHDFVRYLAQKLFNTHLGVDLFSNELELLNDIRAKCGSTGVWSTISGILTAADNQGYDDLSSNICCQVFRQVIKQHPSRFIDISGDAIADTDKFQVPLIVGDTIQFKLTVNAESTQNQVTGLAEASRPVIEGRSYGITLLLAEGPDDPLISEDEPAAP